jgi:polynucleotide 5'-kinase involved in rRNA processing
VSNSYDMRIPVSKSGPMSAEVIIVMGVAGAGKSTYATALAERLGARFVEGDDLLAMVGADCGGSECRSR